MVASIIDRIPTQTPAAQLTPHQRQQLSLAVLSQTQSISQLAAEHGVSRKFCSQQAQKAQTALDQAFDPPPEDSQVLFHLPVTPSWMRQLALALTLIGHASDRAVLEIFATCFDYDRLSLGSLHNLLIDTADRARRINAQEDLWGIRVAAFDEIFQSNQPVLVGVDTQSTYCLLLASEEHYDETVWGVHLLDLERQGLHLQRCVADAGKSFRAGLKAAFGEDVPCQGDVFHAQRLFREVAGFLQHRADACVEVTAKLERQVCRLQSDGRKGVPTQLRQLRKRLEIARAEQRQAQALAHDVGTLASWMNQDVLAVAGEDLATRRMLYDFIVRELGVREGLCPHRLRPLRQALEAQREQLLAFAGVLDEQLGDIAERLDVPEYLVRRVCLLQTLNEKECWYWQRREQLAGALGRRLHAVESAVKAALEGTVRSSSLVENLNSRLRCYFFLRHQVGGPYLDLLRFFLNHRCYLRSRRSERVGKSPAQLLGGQEHPHWLEMLGYRRFHREAGVA
jgi:hypothetical protein